jgi:signal transduction histidine kinase
MPNAGDSLAEVLLQQFPGCSWTADGSGVFQRIYGDPLPVFGKTAAELKGRSASSLDRHHAQGWGSRFGRAFAGETLMLRERRGNSTWYIALFPIVRDGRTVYSGGLAHEITPWSTAEQELRYTVLSALKAQEFERKMASQFLHDSVGQNLTALGLQLDLIRMDLESVSPEVCGRIGEIQKMLETMMEEVRDYSYELNPSTVERAGLRAALDRLMARLHSRYAGAVRINADPSLKIDPKIAPALYHIAQEAVQNAVQHASCSAIEIAVKSTRSGPVLEVRDNGRGFDPGDVLGTRRGLGLLSMEHYAAQAGLQLTITSNGNTGTLVRAAATPEAVSTGGRGAVT